MRFIVKTYGLEKLCPFVGVVSAKTATEAVMASAKKIGWLGYGRIYTSDGGRRANLPLDVDGRRGMWAQAVTRRREMGRRDYEK